MEVGQRFELNGKEYDVSRCCRGRSTRVATKGHACGREDGRPGASSSRRRRGRRRSRSSGDEGGDVGERERRHGGDGDGARPVREAGDARRVIPIPAGSGSHHAGAVEAVRAARPGAYSQLMERFGAWSPGKSQTGSSTRRSRRSDGLNDEGCGRERLLSTAEGLVDGPHDRPAPGVLEVVPTSLKGDAQGGEGAGGLREGARAPGRARVGDPVGPLQPDEGAGRGAVPQALRAGGRSTKVVAGQQAGVLGPVDVAALPELRLVGDGCFATPMAIRHVVMATISADVTGGFEHEQEVAVADPFAVEAGEGAELVGLELRAGKAKWLSRRRTRRRRARCSRCCRRRCTTRATSCRSRRRRR
jgi:hypothetical protein